MPWSKLVRCLAIYLVSRSFFHSSTEHVGHLCLLGLNWKIHNDMQFEAELKLYLTFHRFIMQMEWNRSHFCEHFQCFWLIFFVFSDWFFISSARRAGFIIWQMTQCQGLALTWRPVIEWKTFFSGFRLFLVGKRSGNLKIAKTSSTA